MSTEQKDGIRGKGIYLLPNLFTTAAVFAGFYAIVAAMKGLFDAAAIAIFIAMILDSLDGRVARLTNTQSAFGAEYDSLSDMVAFGLAPALVVYSWALHGLGKFGWLVAFFYTATTALRLARFNVQIESTDPRFFKGLPCPSAAAIVASMVWLGDANDLSISHPMGIIIAVIVLICGTLMVSNIRYYSFKQIDFKGKVPFFAVLIVLLVFVAISIDPPLVLFVGFVVYGLSGFVLLLRSWVKRK